MKTCETLQFRSDVSSQDSGKFVHVQPLDSWHDYQLYEGYHAEQLGLVDGDLGVDGVVTLLRLDSVIHTIYDYTHNLLIQVPGNILKIKILNKLLVLTVIIHKNSLLHSIQKNCGT